MVAQGYPAQRKLYYEIGFQYDRLYPIDSNIVYK